MEAERCDTGKTSFLNVGVSIEPCKEFPFQCIGLGKNILKETARKQVLECEKVKLYGTNQQM